MGKTIEDSTSGKSPCSRGGMLWAVKSTGTSVAPENFEVAPIGIESPFYTVLYINALQGTVARERKNPPIMKFFFSLTKLNMQIKYQLANKMEYYDYSAGYINGRKLK